MKRRCVRCGQHRLVAALLFSGPVCQDCNGESLDDLRIKAEDAARRQANEPGAHPRDEDGRFK